MVYVSTDLGPLAQNVILPLITALLGGKNVIFPLPKNHPGWVRHFNDMIESGKFKAAIDRRYWTTWSRHTGMSRQGRRSATS